MSDFSRVVFSNRVDFVMSTEAENFYKKGLYAISIEDYDAAEFFLLKSIELGGFGASYGCLGWLCGTIFKQELRALYFFRRAIIKDSKNGDLYNDYGALLLKLGHFRHSIKWFLRAVSLSLTHKKHFPLYNLAIVYRNWKRPERSLRCLRLALEYQPDFSEARKLYYSILKNDLKTSSV